MTRETEREMDTGEAVARVGSIANVLAVGVPFGGDVVHRHRNVQALRHLIAEARKVERVRAKYATLEHQESIECPDAGELWAEGFEEAWEDVMLIIDGDPYPETSAPDAETKEVRRG